jgi:glycosyltransferase involved in cell wall biosynthesis
MSERYLLTVAWPITARGGVNEVVLSLARELRKSGFDPIIGASDAEPEPVRGTRVVRLQIDAPLTDEGSSRSLPGFLFRLPGTLLRLRRFLQSERIEIVNAHFPNLSAVCFVFLKWLGLWRGRLVLSFHGADVTGMQKCTPLGKWAWRRLLKWSDAVTTCSGALRGVLLQFSPNLNIVTALNGADIELFAGVRQARSRGQTILNVGRFETKKAQDVLLEAFARIRVEFPESRLILVGADGPQLAAVSQRIDDLNLRDSVEMLVGIPHDQVPQQMGRADIFVLPSRSEGLPLVLIEAGAAGLPIVATTVGGVPEILNDHETALLIPPDDPVALAEALKKLLVDPAFADNLAAEWQRQATTKWTWERTCRDYVSAAGVK